MRSRDGRGARSGLGLGAVADPGGGTEAHARVELPRRRRPARLLALGGAALALRRMQACVAVAVGFMALVLAAGFPVTQVATAATGAGGERIELAKKKKKPTSLAAARKLAKRISKAKNPKATYRALRTAMRGLNLSVYKGNGKPVVAGADRRPHDPYLYDFELRLLAGSLARDERLSLDDVAGEIGALLGGEVSTADVRKALRADVKRSLKRKRAASSRGLLLVRELGLRAKPKYDLARLKPTDEVALDALQKTVLLATVVRGLDPRPRALSRNASPEPKRDTRAGACDQGTRGKRLWRIGESIIDRLPDNIKDKLPSASEGLKAMHAHIVYTGVDTSLSSTSGGTSTHYGPGDHGHDDPNLSSALSPGTPLTYELRVTMKDQISEDVIKCFALAGLRIPEKGGVSGIEVDWNSQFNPGVQNGYDALEKHGKIQRQDETDDQGVARLEFQPHQEVLVGVGRLRRDEGHLAPQVSLLESLGNDGLLGELENVVAPAEIEVWEVEFHEQRARLTIDSKLILPPDAFIGGECNPPSCERKGQVMLHERSSGLVEVAPETGAVTSTPIGIYWEERSGQAEAILDCGDGSTARVAYEVVGVQNSAPGRVVVWRLMGGTGNQPPELWFRIGVAPEELYRVHRRNCLGEEFPPENQSGEFWASWFAMAHDDETVQDDFRIADFSRLSTFAGPAWRKDYSRPVQAPWFTMREETGVQIEPCTSDAPGC